MEIKYKLAALRLLYGLQGKQVAKAIGVSPQTYSGYERGHHTPPLDKLVSLANLYGVSVDKLIGRSSDADDQ